MLPYVSFFAGTTGGRAPACPDPAKVTPASAMSCGVATPGADRPLSAAYANSEVRGAHHAGCCLLGYPFAYRLARAPEVMRNTPADAGDAAVLTSFLLRCVCRMGCFDSSDWLINQALLGLA